MDTYSVEERGSSFKIMCDGKQIASLYKEGDNRQKADLIVKALNAYGKYGHLLESYQMLFDERPKLQAISNALETALRGIVANWDKRMMGEVEQYKHYPYPNQSEGYWSPASSLVDSEHIAKARQVLKNINDELFPPAT